MMLWLPTSAHAQSTATQDRQAATTANEERQAPPGDDASRRDVGSFDRFLDDHREVAEQVRKDPSLLDNRDFVRDHPALQDYLRDNPGVRDQLRQDPTAFMRQADMFARDQNPRVGDAGGRDRDDLRGVASFDRFLNDHREIGEQVRKDPGLLDDRRFVDDHPALQAYLAGNPGVRDQLRQDPNAFVRQAERSDHDSNFRDRDAHDRMADFGGFLHNHSDIDRDVARDPDRLKDHDYVHNHPELETYLNAHPGVRNDMMANPQNFVAGAHQSYNGTGTSTGTGVSGSGAGTTGAAGMGSHENGTSAGAGVNDHTTTSTPGTSPGAATTPETTPHSSKPNL
jgi:hypothetical protein